VAYKTRWDTGLHTLYLILDKRLPPSYELPIAFLLNKLLTLLALHTSHTALTWINSHQQHTLNDSINADVKKATQLPQPPAPLQTSPISILTDSFLIEGKPLGTFSETHSPSEKLLHQLSSLLSMVE
jgi:hypothetical protein